MALCKVEICGVDTTKLPILKEEEKKALFERIKKGDELAKEEYIRGNLRLVLSVIKRFGNSNENMDDLFQVGCIGLIKAINNFNTELEVKFSTYAVPTSIECREHSERSVLMTRKQALNKAIEALAVNEENNEAIEVLKGIRDKLPLIRYDDETIRDSVEQFIVDKGRIPTATDLKKENNLPAHSMFKCIYGITFVEWIEQNYEVQKMTIDERRELYTKDFIEDYYRIKPKSQEQFNKNRRTETRGWQTIAQLHNVSSWRNLLKKLDLPLYFEMYRDRKPEQFDIKVYLHKDFGK